MIVVRRAASLALLVVGLCAFDPTSGDEAIIEGRRAFEAAHTAPQDSPHRARLWLDCATKYEAIFRQHPTADFAPEAAMNAAHAWKQLGNFTHVLAIYKEYVERYGNEQRLAELEAAQPRSAVTARRFEQHVTYVFAGYEALAQLEVAMFDYAGAAKTYASISGNARFPKEKRVDAARNAIVLFGPLGQRDAQMAERDKLVKLDKDMAIDVDYLVASYGYRDGELLDKPTAQKTARSLEAFVDKYLPLTPKGHRNLVEGSLYAARLERQLGDEAATTKWLEKTVRAFDALKASSPRSAITPATEVQVVEADRLLLDASTKRDLQKTTNVKAAEALDARLAKVATKYSGSSEWTIAVSTNRGSVWDSLRVSSSDAERLAVRHYAVADFIARQSNLDAKVATARLADLSAQLGDAKMKAYVTSGAESPTLTYTDGMYARRGLPNAQSVIAASVPTPP